VAPRVQGRGIGRGLLGEAVRRAPALGLRTLLGFVFAHNLPSLGLFEAWASRGAAGSRASRSSTASSGTS
jgi:phosphinothricin acetyltransferase